MADLLQRVFGVTDHSLAAYLRAHNWQSETAHDNRTVFYDSNDQTIAIVEYDNAKSEMKSVFLL